MISWSFASTSRLTSYLWQARSHVWLWIFEIPHRPDEMFITVWLLTTIFGSTSRVFQVCHGVTNTSYRGFLALFNRNRVLLQNKWVSLVIPNSGLWASSRMGHLFKLIILCRPISEYTHVYFCKFWCISQSFGFHKVGETVFEEIVRKLLLKNMRNFHLLLTLVKFVNIILSRVFRTTGLHRLVGSVRL